MTLSGARSLWTVLTGTVIVGFAASLIGCASAGPITPVEVSDVKSVAGTWKGTVYRSGFAPDYVTLTIRVNEVNSVPTVSITAPAPFSGACTSVPIMGTATGVNFNSYVLEYSSNPAGPFSLITYEDVKRAADANNMTVTQALANIAKTADKDRGDHPAEYPQAA